MSISNGRRLYSETILTNIERLTISNIGAGYVNMFLLRVEWVEMRKLSSESTNSDRTLPLDILNKNNMSARFRLEEGVRMFKIFRISVLLRGLVEGTLYLTMAMKKLKTELRRVQWVEEAIFQMGEQYSNITWNESFRKKKLREERFSGTEWAFH